MASRACAGDHAAYARLVRIHEEVAFRVAYLVTGSAADAEDAAQEAFVKAYLALDRFDPKRPFRPWLLQIVANEAKNRVRSSARRVAYENRATHLAAVGLAHSPERAVEEADTRRRLIEAVNDLPQAERLVIGLRYFLQLSEAETATAAGIPSGTVKSRASRALARLRVALEEGLAHDRS